MGAESDAGNGGGGGATPNVAQTQHAATVPTIAAAQNSLNSLHYHDLQIPHHPSSHRAGLC
jgi:hypothetical protein